MDKILENIINDLKKLVEGNTDTQINQNQVLMVIKSNNVTDNNKIGRYVSEVNKWLSKEGLLLSDTEDSTETEDLKIKPFDFTNMKLSTLTLTLGNIIDRLENDEIDLFPDFQRLGGLWNNERKSRLIESLILGIPLPSFYFDATNNNSWVIVDGLQRLTAINEYFVTKKLVLSGMEFLKDLNGKGFDQVPPSYNRRMKEKNLTGVFINEGTPLEVRLNIFKRLNTGGLHLTQQEIIHALAPQRVRLFLKKYANDDKFRKATDYSIDFTRMADREFVLRFASYILCGVEVFKQVETMEAFLDRGIQALSTKSDAELELLGLSFTQTMELAFNVFGKNAFRRITSESRRPPISKALFDAVSVEFSRLEKQEATRLINNKSVIIEKLKNEFENLNGQFYHDVRSGRATSAEGRLRKMRELIEESIK